MTIKDLAFRARTTGVCEPSASRHFCRKDLLSARRRTRRRLARRRPRLVLRGGNRRCSTVVQRVAEGRPHAQIPRGQQLIWARGGFLRAKSISTSPRVEREQKTAAAAAAGPEAHDGRTRQEAHDCAGGKRSCTPAAPPCPSSSAAPARRLHPTEGPASPPPRPPRGVCRGRVPRGHAAWRLEKIMENLRTEEVVRVKVFSTPSSTCVSSTKYSR